MYEKVANRSARLTIPATASEWMGCTANIIAATNDVLHLSLKNISPKSNMKQLMKV